MSDDLKRLPSESYAYGFQDPIEPLTRFEPGLDQAKVERISHIKNEPKWMLDYRLCAFECYNNEPLPSWGVDLSAVDFEAYTYYSSTHTTSEKSWDDVPETIRNTFQKLGIPQAEAEFLSGVTTQYDSQVVYGSLLKELEDKGVVFLDMDTALQTYPDLVKTYFGTLVPLDDNKFASLNTSVWSGGTFIYVPKGVKLDKPLQSYFRINGIQMGQFERTLIIVDEGADIHYIEGCTAPIHSASSLHAAVVEIFVLKHATCRYTTIQNWSQNVRNLVTKRAWVGAHGSMEWIDGNIGAMQTMKYPTCILAEPHAKGSTITIAVATGDQWQDTGAKMIHQAPYTQSSIVSKSVARKGGTVHYRGIVSHGENAMHAKSKIECDTLILDRESQSDTMPINVVKAKESVIEHEAHVSNVSEQEMFYLMSRGLTEGQAQETIIMGFLEPFTKELPMEYAVELNQLMKLDMEGSVG